MPGKKPRNTPSAQTNPKMRGSVRHTTRRMDGPRAHLGGGTPTSVGLPELIGAPSEKMLERAGRLGLADPEIKRIASKLVVLALDGGRRLGGDYVKRQHLEAAYQYFARAL